MSKSQTGTSPDIEKRVPNPIRPRVRNGSGSSVKLLTPHPHWSKLMKDLCLTFVTEGDDGYYALRMIDLPPCDLEAPLEARWSSLKQGTRVSVDKTTSVEYAQGVLIPRLVVDLYSSPSEVLVDRALKIMVLGRVINIMDNKAEGLQKEITELKAGSGLEAIVATELRASKAQTLTDHLKTELEEVTHLESPWIWS
ncbi:hypothetical protein B296_00012274 [Ensete ventricosum]|uniref:Uncharacterized protein n=1 Tax=Ensete ventricosum TaxID=4639 RepID=A0A426ZS29_ENSVE|nr:hypothetical protein B296_00012274 [Ensete ventricosum]